MSSLDYIDLCRLCLVKDHVNVPIFEGEGDVRQIFLKIAACLPVKVAREDKLPKKICDDCVYKVESFYQFWNTTASAEKQLFQWIGEDNLEDKQGYVSVMKQEQNSENRFGSNVIQVAGNQNNMDIRLMDNMGLGMPIIISSSNQQQISSVPLDSADNSVTQVQAVPSSSSHEQMSQSQTNIATQEEDDDESDDDNMDDECDGDEGLSVKEEGEDELNSNKSIESSTFVNVGITCDQAGPSGLQQQKITEMTDIGLQQTSDEDPKSGTGSLYGQISKVRKVGSLKTKAWTCEICTLQFPIESMLKRHRSTHRQRARKSFKRTSYPRSKTPSRDIEKEDDTETKCDELQDYQCDRCDYQTTLKVLLDAHYTHKHSSEESFACYMCEFVCQRKSVLSNHIAKKHRVQKSQEDDCYACNLCEFRCAKKNTLYSHRRRQHMQQTETKIYSCKECGFKTSKRSSLYSHQKRKHKIYNSNGEEQELFSCNECDYKNKNKYELKIHMARKHSLDFQFSCEFCGKKFKVKGDLTNHVRFTHTEQPVICDVCGKTCLNSNSLYVHQKFAHYKAKYECQICKRRMVTQENLDEHMLRQHEQRENAVCEECGKTFSRNSRLKIHMRIHTGDKPYSCTVCEKNFARRNALKQHLLIHTGQRPYICDICGKAFTQKPGLISHRKSHPGSHPPLPRVLIDHILCDVMPS